MKRFFLPLFALAIFLFIGCSEDPVTPTEPEPNWSEYWMIRHHVGLYSQRMAELDEQALLKLDKIIQKGDTEIPYFDYPFVEYQFIPPGNYEVKGFTGKFADKEGVPYIKPNGLRPYEYFTQNNDQEILYFGYAVMGKHSFILVVAERGY